MPYSQPRIAVIGAGAIGGVVACRLAREHPEMQVACKHQRIASLARDPGARVFGLGGESRTRLNAVARIEEITGPLDLVFLTTKAGDAVPAAQRLLPLLKETSWVVSLQNGISEEALARVLGPDRVVGCVVGWGGTHHAPAELEVTSPGGLVIGAWGRAQPERLAALQDMMQAVAPTRVSDNIRGELFSKLVVNACINPLGALTGQSLGRLLASHRTRSLFTQVMRETMAVAHALGIKVEPAGGGKLDFHRMIEGQSWLAGLRRHGVVCLVGLKYRRIRSSSLQSLERGRPSEMPYLNGYICEQGQRTGVPTPLNQALVDMVAQIEAGQRDITPANLDDPALALG